MLHCDWMGGRSRQQQRVEQRERNNVFICSFQRQVNTNADSSEVDQSS
jgi:hypothetical protein